MISYTITNSKRILKHLDTVIWVPLKKQQLLVAILK